jgi:hypothetical protein
MKRRMPFLAAVALACATPGAVLSQTASPSTRC